jgi:cytochrome c553
MGKESLMRTLIILSAVFFAHSQTAVAGDTAPGETKAETCAGCHNAMASLNGRGADAIAGQMKAIRSGDKEHLLELTDLSDEDIADIAAYLDGA